MRKGVGGSPICRLLSGIEPTDEHSAQGHCQEQRLLSCGPETSEFVPVKGAGVTEGQSWRTPVLLSVKPLVSCPLGTCGCAKEAGEEDRQTCPPSTGRTLQC